MSPNNSLSGVLRAISARATALLRPRKILLFPVLLGAVLLGASAAVGVFIFSSAGSSWAQQPGGIGFAAAANRADEQADNAQDGRFSPPKWATRQSLKRAKDLLAKGDYTDGLQLLDNILQGDEDYFLPTVDDELQSASDSSSQQAVPDRTPINGPRNRLARPFQPGGNSPSNNSAELADTSRRGLKEEVERLICNLPPEGIKAYETLFGAKAQRMLSDALSANDIDGVGQVARRYFSTKAGSDAALLVGIWDLDHGQALAGARCLARLHAVSTGAAYEPSLSVLLAYCWLRGGEKDRARDVLLDLQRNDPGATIRIGDKSARLFSDESQAIAWLTETFGNEPIPIPPQLSQWAIYRGNAERNAASAGGTPLMDPHWRVPTTDDETEVVKSRQDNLVHNIPIVPAIQPLAVGDVVLMRTATGLLAVDFVTGKRIWDVGPMGDPQTDASGNSDRSAGQPSGDPALSERLWENATLGTLSSDGHSVFMVQEPRSDGMAMEQQQIRIRQFGNRMFQSQLDTLSNVLAAYDLPTQGKLRWIVGGGSERSDFSAEPALRKAFFLGPPLPLNDQLYALAELQGEITLVALDAKTGKLLWKQQLVSVADANSSPYQDTYRRLTGATPSFADGVLVCPTSAGAVVAVDLATHKLLWGYEYPSNQVGGQMQMGGRIFFNGGYASTSISGDRWIDSTATIADGRVLITPVEGDQWIYCLSLIDGRLLWKRERGDDIYVAGVHDGKVILVGKRKIEAVSLANDGPASLQRPKLLWSLDLSKTPDDAGSGSKTTDSRDATPSGRGFLSGGQYFLPLSTAEVACIDLDQGKIISRARSRKGYVPGNLICYKGDVVSLGVDSLDAFYQLDPLRQRVTAALEKNPDDPESLALRGQIALDAGKLTDAIHDIRRAYDKDTSEAARAVTRGLLVDAMLAALRSDFKGSRMSIGELQKLISLDSEQAEFLRMLAEGLQKSGDRLAAVDAYLKLADLKWGQGDPEPIEPNLSVRRDHWVEARLESLYSEAASDHQSSDRAKIDALLSDRVKDVVADKNDKELRDYISYFGFHPTADVARAELARSLSNNNEAVLERQLLLSQLEESGDPALRRFATAELADLLKAASRPEEAAIYYRRLSTEFANQICVDGKTGKQLVEELGADSAETHEMNSSFHWPAGAVKHDGSRNAQMPYQSPFPISWQGDRGPFFQTTTILYDLQQQIVGRDGMGREKFRIPLTEAGQNRFIGYQPMSPAFVAAKGHLLFANLGSQLIALDTLRPMNAGNRVLWEQELIDMNSNVFNGPVEGRRISLPWGQTRQVEQFGDTSPFSLVGPVTNRCVCISRSHDLIALDPLSGATVWTWSGVPAGAEVFGDDDVLIVAPTSGAGAVVLRTADGQQLGTCTVPPIDRRGGYHGRRVLTWQAVHDDNRESVEILLADPWKGQDYHLGTFALGMRGTIVDDQFLAILDHGNRFRIVSLDDGRKLVDEHIALDTEVGEILVQATPDQFVMLAKKPNREQAQFNNNPYVQMNMQGPETGLQQFSGSVMAFDRATGKPCWSVPAVVENITRQNDDEEEYVALSEGTELPVIVFVGIPRPGTRQTNGEVPGSILCLDRRTGRAIIDEDVPQQVNNPHVSMSGDRQANTVTINVSNHTFNLTLTDDPTPPAPPYQAKLARMAKMKTPSMGAPLQSILNAIRGGDNR